MTTTPGSADYWDHRYESIGATNVSWFQATPQPSLEAIAALGVSTSAAIVDVGGGASTLVDELLARGFADITVIDLSQRALDTAAARLASNPHVGSVAFIRTDIREWQPDRDFDLWHDRAAYHFLTDPTDQRRYWELVSEHLRPGGHVIIATFAEDGPEMCSGLPVQRNSPEQLLAAMGGNFTKVSTQRETHTTPSGGQQRFVWVTARRN